MKYLNFLFIALAAVLFGFTPNKTAKCIQSPPPGDTISVSGTLNSYYFYSIDQLDSCSIDSSHVAEFYPQPPTSTIYAGNVSINSTSILYNSSTLNYAQDNSNGNLVTMSPLNWNVSGNKPINPVTYSYTPKYPKFSYATLPNAYDKSVGITINLTGLQNLASDYTFLGTAIILQDNGAIQAIKTIDNTSSSFSFSSSDLSSFNSNSPISILISLQNVKYVKIGTQGYLFVTTTYYRKECNLN